MLGDWGEINFQLPKSFIPQYCFTMPHQNTSDAALIRPVIDEVMKSLDTAPYLKRIPSKFHRLERMLNIFQPHVLQDAAQGILSPTNRMSFDIRNTVIVNGKIQFVYTALPNEANSKYPIELCEKDLLLITQNDGYYEGNEVNEILHRRFRFAFVVKVLKKSAAIGRGNTGYVARLQFIESNQGHELDIYEVEDILNSTCNIDVLTTMVPFIRVFKSLISSEMHEKSPLLSIILKDGERNTWNPNDYDTIKFLVGDPYYRSLNKLQKEVANHVIYGMSRASDLTLVQGPPGTGKTFSTCVMIFNAVRHPLREGPIVVCAPSNVAVARSANKFVEMYCEADVFDLNRLIILGRDDKMDNAKVLSRLAFTRFCGTSSNNRLRKQWNKIKYKVDIIFCTVSCVMSKRMQNLDYSHVFCDEAGQVDEASALMLVQNSVKQLVMIGDPKQLPPFTLIKGAKALHSNRSLFERFWELKHSCCSMLKTQYRMDPIISKMVSDFMYDGQLKNGENVYKYSMDFDYPFKKLEFIKVSGAEVNCKPSYKNEKEALKVVKIINQILDKHRLKDRDLGGLAPSIGIITGYAAQRDRIRRLLNHRKNEDIQIDTFDSFQGQEKDIVILSLVRTAGIGFNKDPNRVNVAISRARKSLLIVGKYSNFATRKPWNNIIKYIDGLQQDDPIRNNPCRKSRPMKLEQFQAAEGEILEKKTKACKRRRRRRRRRRHKEII
eukprot:NODE_42_length_29671_cov_0.584810.p2 type:complete len:721 gc:universal NODE_42_length_29671_cov_0.584810:8520-6358(-)